MKTEPKIVTIEGRRYQVLPIPLMSNMFLKVRWYLKDCSDSSVEQIENASRIVQVRKQ